MFNRVYFYKRSFEMEKKMVKNPASKEESDMTEKEVFTAVWCNNVKKIKEYASQKVNLNIQDGFGDTPLIKAVSRNFEEMVQVLIAAGCRLDTQNMRGETALISAAKIGNEKLLCSLIKAGADVDICNAHGETVFDFVKNADVIHLLDQARQSEKGQKVQKFKDFVWGASAQKIVQQFETKNFLTSLRLYGLFAEAFQRLSANDIHKVNSLLEGQVTAHEQVQMDKVYRAKIKGQRVRV